MLTDIVTIKDIWPVIEPIAICAFTILGSIAIIAIIIWIIKSIFRRRK